MGSPVDQSRVDEIYQDAAAIHDSIVVFRETWSQPVFPFAGGDYEARVRLIERLHDAECELERFAKALLRSVARAADPQESA